MPQLLTEIYHLQEKLTELDDYERNLLKMCANLLESHHDVPNPRSLLSAAEYLALPGRWELLGGKLYPYEPGD